MSSPAAASPLRRLIAYSGRHRSRVRQAVLCSILNKIFDLAPPLLIGTAVDIVVRREQSFLAGFGVPEVGTQLWMQYAIDDDAHPSGTSLSNAVLATQT